MELVRIMGKDKKELNNISLRDYFAGQVLNGLLANVHLQKCFLKDSKAFVKSFEGLDEDDIKVSEMMHYYHAMISYKFADAMIKQSKN